MDDNLIGKTLKYWLTKSATPFLHVTNNLIDLANCTSHDIRRLE